MPELNTDWTPVKMPSGPQRPNLVIVRTGGGSLHKKWPQDLPQGEARTWDLLVSHYDANSDPDPDAEIAVRQGAFKYAACARLFHDIGWLGDYQYIWFCDDDIMTSWSGINRMFAFCAAQGLWLAQPALTKDSFFSFPFLLQKPEYLLRFTNFVEIMVPVFAASALKKCLPSWAGAVTGWGMDFVWPYLLGYPQNKIGVIDATPVHHTRKAATGPIYDDARALKVEPLDELAANLKKYGISRAKEIEFGVLWAEPHPADAQKDDWEKKLAAFALSSLSERPSTWPSRFRAPAWTGGPPQEYPLPPMTSDDKAMSLSVTLKLDRSAGERRAELFRVGNSEGALRLIVLAVTTTEGRYRMALNLINRTGSPMTLMSPELPFDHEVAFTMQIVPALGWVRCWVNDQVAGNAMIEPYRWKGAETVRIGSPGLDGQVGPFWLQPCLFKTDF